MFKITPIPLTRICAHLEEFNSNNHWYPSNGSSDYKVDGHSDKPDDYEEVLAKSKTLNWVHLFHKNYQTVDIGKKDIEWLNKAQKVGCITRKFPKLYEFQSKLEDMLDRYQFVDKIFKDVPEGYFVRTEHVSLKYGQHGAGPYKDFKSVIESLVTTIPTHTPVRDDLDNIRLYFLPWINNLNEDAEFRVFVHNNKVTAISQQRWYSTNELLKDKDDTVIQNMIKQIVDYHTDVITKRITHTKNYSMDIAILNPITDQSEVYFIEVNSFGKEYAAGSSLFHWLTDEKVLYDDGSTVEFRYVVDK